MNLIWQPGPKHTLDPLLLPMLYSRQEEPGPLLCRVHTVTLSAQDFDEQAIYPRLIIGPSLQSITINAFRVSSFTEEHVGVISWSNIGALLRSYAPKLQVLKIDPLYLNCDFVVCPLQSAALNEVIRNLDALRVVEAMSHTVDNETLWTLATLPCLEQLTVSLIDADLAQFARQWQPATGVFRTLRKLHFHGVDLTVCASILQLTRAFPCLEEIKVTGEKDMLWVLDPFVLAVSQTENLSRNVTSIDLKIEFIPWEPFSQTTPTCIDLPSISPLFSLAQLRILRLDLGINAILDNDALAVIGAALPGLEVLHLADPAIDTIPTLTITGLIPLLNSCPRLSNLAIRVDATRDVAALALSGTLAPHLNLRLLDVCRSPISSPQNIALFLASLCPKLIHLSNTWRYALPTGEVYTFTMNQGDNNHLTMWDYVQDLLSPMMQQS
ncbi:hypothetical protein DXG01_008920 [Tephrocybe rancida]|nr:hypothetical protein DXG01_008920 [Tephrocybe rancida]